jgi:GntR family transcriptional repressor for pyruvate dehydrogenase complex
MVSPISSSRAILSLRPIESRRAFEEILDQLEEAILAGQLSVGDKLPPERELAAQLGVSRASVREALRVLEALGLVEVRRGAEHGVRLREEPGNAFADVLRFLVALRHLTTETVLSFRLVLQVWAAGCAAEHRDDHLLGLLRATVERMETEPLDPSQFRSADVDFHSTLVRAGQNELATLIFEAIRHSVQQMILEAFLREADWESLRERLTQEHRGILTAIESGDVELSKRLVEDHIRGFWATRLDDGKP